MFVELEGEVEVAVSVGITVEVEVVISVGMAVFKDLIAITPGVSLILDETGRQADRSIPISINIENALAELIMAVVRGLASRGQSYGSR